MRDIKTREMDMSGPLVQFDYTNAKGGNATLDNIIRIGTTVNITTTVREVMHIQRGFLCYTYDSLY
jgi:tyrosinase